MRRLMFLILALATLLPISAQAYDVLILQSKRTPANDELLKGFGFDRKSSLRMLVMADYAEFDLGRIVREDKPRLILALGDSAVRAARTVQNTPVLTTMSLAATEAGTKAAHFAGFGMIASPHQYLALFQKMNKRRIGLIHNPAKTGWYVKEARKAAADAGMELVVREVTTPRDTARSLASLSGTIDALWMLPDTTSVTRETVEAFFVFAQSQNIPLVSFAAPYLDMGAAAVVEINPYAIGRQADELAARILSGADISLRMAYPDKTGVKTNPAVMKRLGLTM